ncbi:MAG: AbrB/MazE/SpoVT family DNA-binding domain-containing protein [Gammaproteobacteria bacterium]|nr:MAG: AbrB/MazE/SpoVT family DNA-binding domain-containing protein [Gammaproteobacteria bacterium]
MAKVTSKLQLTLPKRIAEQFGIAPGDEVEFAAAGDIIHLIPAGRPRTPRLDREERLRLFDECTTRQRQREGRMHLPERPVTDRDWCREDLYTRGPNLHDASEETD